MPDTLHEQNDELDLEPASKTATSNASITSDDPEDDLDSEQESYTNLLSGDQIAERGKRVSILSPLRYPGSKRRLASYIAKAIQKNGLHPSLFVEPFAGGASVALQLLNDKLVDQIGLIDLDPFIAAFWKTVFFDADWLVDQVETIEVTLEQWYRYKRSDPKERRERALTCLFLNRTSFSGIIAPTVGPIGGKNQASAYEINCRFPVKTLVKRIRQAEALKDRVAFVWNLTWSSGLTRMQQMQQRGSLPKDVFLYLDPPFFEKADKLYRYYFSDDDHLHLRDTVLQLKPPWILSYDSPNHVKELYGDLMGDAAHVELLYSASKKGGSRAAREAIITNLKELPRENVLWRKWHKKTKESNVVTPELFPNTELDNGVFAVSDA